MYQRHSNHSQTANSSRNNWIVKKILKKPKKNPSNTNKTLYNHCFHSDFLNKKKTYFTKIITLPKPPPLLNILQMLKWWLLIMCGFYFQLLYNENINFLKDTTFLITFTKNNLRNNKGYNILDR